MNKPTLLRTSLLGLLAFSYSHAQVTVVQWGTGTDIVSANQGVTSAFEGENDTSLNTGTSSNPTVGADYYNSNTGRNPVFFANSVNTQGTGTSFSIANDFTADSVDYDIITFNISADSNVSNRASALVMWTKAGDGSFGFLNGGDSNDVTLSSLSATGNVNSVANSSFETRFVIQLGSTYYISEDLGRFGTGNQGYTTLSIADVTAAAWSAYDPVTNFTTTIGSTVTLSDFSDLNAVGLYYDRDVTGTNRFSNLYLAGFEAQGTVVPEPSSFALLLGAVTMALVATRRRRN